MARFWSWTAWSLEVAGALQEIYELFTVGYDESCGSAVGPRAQLGLVRAKRPASAPSTSREPLPVRLGPRGQGRQGNRKQSTVPGGCPIIVYLIASVLDSHFPDGVYSYRVKAPSRHRKTSISCGDGFSRHPSSGTTKGYRLRGRTPALALNLPVWRPDSTQTAPCIAPPPAPGSSAGP